MSSNWLKEINNTCGNTDLIGRILLKSIIKPWLSSNIINPFFKSDTNKSWEYIFLKDIECQSSGNNHHMICSTNLHRFLGGANINTVCNTYKNLSEDTRQNATPADLGITSIQPLASAKLDLQAMAKILRYRVYVNYKKCNGSRLHEWAEKIILLRNTVAAHENDSIALEWTNEKCKSTIEEIITLTENAKLSADNEWPDFGGELKTAFEELEKELTDFLEAFRKITDGTALNISRCNLYKVYDLFKYKVLFTFVDTSNDYTLRFITQFSEWYSTDKRNNHFYIDSITIERLANESKTNYYAKSILKTLTAQLDNGVLIPLNTELSHLNLTDLITENLRSAQGKWCIITGNEQLAKDISELKNPDIVVMKVVDSQTLTPFIIENNDPVNFSFSFETAKADSTHQSSENEIVQEEIPAPVVISQTEETLEIPQTKTDGSVSPFSPITETTQKKKLVKNMPKTGGIVFNESSEQPQILYNEVSKGGEGVIYDTGMGYKYIKLYHDNIWNESRANKISAMRAFAPHLPETICWPLEAVFHPDKSPEPIGYEMLNVKSKSPEAIALDELLYDLSYNNNWKWSRSNLVQLCINIAKNFQMLHKNNIIMGDVNPKNILVNKNGKAWFIDTDSYQFSYNGTMYRCEVGTPEFSSPALHNKKCKFRKVDRTHNDEYFAIACLFFQILFLGESPFPTEDKNIKYSIINNRFRLREGKSRHQNYKWGNLTSDIQKVFDDTFSSGKYIDESEWIMWLSELDKAITDGKLSDMLDPTSAPQPGVEVKLVYLECNECGEEFEFFKSDKSSPDDHFCPSCKKSRNLLRTKIIRLKCKDCGAIFTVNKWDMIRRFWEDDLDEFDTDNATCPDCDNHVCVPNENKFIKDHSEIVKAMQYAYKNSKRKREF